MIYTDQTKTAMKIAFDAHKNQADKAGMPYVFHPFYLATQMLDEVSVCAALLHDVVEDTDVTFDDMASMGIGQEVIDVIRLLTHDEDTPYMEYVQKIKDSENLAAIAVKLADLRHNADASRFNSIDAKTSLRIEKYQHAMHILEC